MGKCGCRPLDQPHAREGWRRVGCGRSEVGAAVGVAAGEVAGAMVGEGVGQSASAGWCIPLVLHCLLGQVRLCQLQGGEAKNAFAF